MAVDVGIPLSVGEVARRAGVTIATVHFYETKGLIQGWRNKGNQRRYARDVLRRLAVIRVAQRAGISLATIREGFDQFPSDRPLTAKDWQALSSHWRDMLNTRIESLTQLRDQLDGCIGCGCLSQSDCPLRNAGDQLAQKGSGAVLLASAGMD